jgi:hypothetical protein
VRIPVPVIGSLNVSEYRVREEKESNPDASSEPRTWYPDVVVTTYFCKKVGGLSPFYRFVNLDTTIGGCFRAPGNQPAILIHFNSEYFS